MVKYIKNSDDFYSFEKLSFDKIFFLDLVPVRSCKIFKDFIHLKITCSNNTKIVFNMNSQGISSLNYRTFQTVACKRLLISDYREELNLFESYMPFYEDFSDLTFKIESYLEDKEAYNKIVEKCYEIAKKSHNSKDCVRFMLETVK